MQGGLYLASLTRLGLVALTKGSKFPAVFAQGYTQIPKGMAFAPFDLAYPLARCRNE